MKDIRFLIITCFLILQTGNLCFAARTLTGVSFSIRENGTNTYISLPNETFGTLYNESNDQVEVCFSDHQTDAGRRFEHIHVSFSIPANGLEITNILNPSATITVTNDKIKAYWDFYYGPPRIPAYTGGTGVTFSQNCWGWTFGYNCWIQDPTYIYADNYDLAPANPTSIPTKQAVCKLAGHVQELTQLRIHAPLGPGIPPSEFFALVITEKNRESGIYTYHGTGLGHYPGGLIYIKK